MVRKRTNHGASKGAERDRYSHPRFNKTTQSESRTRSVDADSVFPDGIHTGMEDSARIPSFWATVSAGANVIAGPQTPN